MAQETVPKPTTGATARSRKPAGAKSKAGANGMEKPQKPQQTRGVQPPGYNFSEFEAKWRERWEASGLYRPDLRRAKRPYYNLMMFPYPSAEGLHVGNMYAYVGSDIHGRWQAMNGFDVFEPMGFDAFGIHSENFAIKRGLHPKALTAQNVRRFREEQLMRIGNRFDWSHEVQTTDPRYYRWTQWIFVQLFKAGLAERKRAAVNWCPKDKTVLADEQVINGHCERCGTLVERRWLEQWFLKITDYADKLLDNLDTLDWSDRVKNIQRSWIGRSQGLAFDLPVAGASEERIRVYTTRPDTIYGVTFVALAPQHPALERIVVPAQRAAVSAYQEEAAHRRADAEAGERPMTGVFTGAYAVHPLTGEQVPIWVADYVLMEYGTGAIMGVPAHDERDLSFAHIVGLPVRRVVAPTGAIGNAESLDVAFTDSGTLVESGAYTGLASEQAAEAIIAEMEARGLGERTKTYHLRDWLISRQRYWGPPIPIIYCPDHGAVPVPEDQLPVLLPDVEEYAPTGTGASPLAHIAEFVETTCPICGKPARRETDVSDNFLDSAWYFLRYPSSDDDTQPWDAKLTRKWLPVDMYIGGAEHSVLHLMYARFITMAMHDLGHLAFEEPFTRFRANGTITAEGAKISKSKGNVINPDEYIERYGADIFRTYLVFMGPYEQGGDFSDRGIGGVVRFLERVWRLVEQHASNASNEQPEGEARRVMHSTIKRVTDDIDVLKYNTCIAALMEYLNSLEARQEAITRHELRTLLALLAPFAPYIAEELWERVGGSKGSVHRQQWPAYDEAALRRETVTVVVQVNGKVRGQLELPLEADEAEVRTAALASERVQSAIGDATVRRTVYVPGRLINIVVG